MVYYFLILEIYNNIVKSKVQRNETKINQGNSIKINSVEQKEESKKGCC
jgi:hypothetical protein